MRTVVALFLLIGIWPAYVALAWRVRRGAGRRALWASWIGVAAGYGYLRYRFTCSQALTCDVGGQSPYFLSGNPYYFTHYVPVFAAIGLVAFGAATLVVDGWRNAGVENRSFTRTVVMGTLVAITGFILATLTAGALSIHPV
jgi:hypothetical protein